MEEKVGGSMSKRLENYNHAIKNIYFHQKGGKNEIKRTISIIKIKTSPRWSQKSREGGLVMGIERRARDSRSLGIQTLGCFILFV